MLLLVLVTSSVCFSQDFTSKEVKALNSLGFNPYSRNQSNTSYLSDLKEISEKESKRRINKSWGVTLVSVGIVSTILGASILAEPKSENGIGQAVQGVLGGGLLGVGLVSASISIPLFSSSKKRKNERDKLIEKYIAKRHPR